MALLAFHIEAALNSDVSDLVRTMSRISISQTMLLLSQGKDIPVVGGALPIFEEILMMKKLYWAVLDHDRTTAQSQFQQNTYENTTGLEEACRVVEGDSTLQNDGSGVASGPQYRFGADVSFGIDFLGFDFLHDW